MNILEKIILKNNDYKQKRHPKCKGYMTTDYGNGSEYECGYETTIDCSECKYGWGRKNPESICNIKRGKVIQGRLSWMFIGN